MSLLFAHPLFSGTTPDERVHVERIPGGWLSKGPLCSSSAEGDTAGHALYLETLSSCVLHSFSAFHLPGLQI